MPEIRRDDPDAEKTLVSGKGQEHEAKYLERVRGRFPELVNLTDQPYDRAIEAMRRGVPVLYQATLQHHTWQGIADFLFRAEGDSLLGQFYYEPWDTKLARSPKPYFLVQLCAYADLLEQVQGSRPRNLVLVLGESEERRFSANDFFFHYLNLKDQFLGFQENWNSTSYPDPGSDRSWGSWTTLAGDLLDEADHLEPSREYHSGPDRAAGRQRNHHDGRSRRL